MQRTLTMFMLVGVGLAFCCYAAPQEDGRGRQADAISNLQKQRIELLQERVSKIESLHKADLADREQVIRMKVDLHNARLDYPQSLVAKRQLLKALVKEYDQLIQIAEAKVKAPPAPSRTGGRRKIASAVSNLYWLKAERVRVQIDLESLD